MPCRRAQPVSKAVEAAGVVQYGATMRKAAQSQRSKGVATGNRNAPGGLKHCAMIDERKASHKVFFSEIGAFFFLKRMVIFIHV